MEEKKTTLALRALAELEQESPGEKFTTAEIARQAGDYNRSAGAWTKPWREALFALMSVGLVRSPVSRPHRWALTPSGRERVAGMPGGDRLMRILVP